MKSNKKTQGFKEDNDLKFAPLDIKEPFKFNTSTLSPSIRFDGKTITTNSKGISVDLQPFLNTFDRESMDTRQNLTIPLMPYPISTPSFETSDINNATPNSESTKISENDLNYPSELEQNDLYSYNQTRGSNEYLNNIINPIDILRTFDLQEDIIDTESRSGYTNADIDAIFESMKSNNSNIFGTFKIYKIPYPIAKLLVKKIIKLTLDYSKGR